MQKRVVIVGGGFGGVKAALELSGDKRFSVTLISSRSTFEYHAALYRSVTGRSVLEVAIPLADIFAGKPNIEIVEDSIERIEFNKQTVIGSHGSRYFYDRLVLALGSVTEYYGIRGLEKHSFGVKSVNEALRLRRHLHDRLDWPGDDEHYVVVGAGPTGVELAAELHGYLQQLYHRHKVSGKRFTVDVVEAATDVLPSVPELSRLVKQRLQKLGIELSLDTAVEGETADTLRLPHGNIDTHTVVWTAGVAAHPLFSAHPQLFKLGKGGRVEVDKRLQVAPGVYVLGDCALTKYSGMAQTALYDGWFAAQDIKGNQVTYDPPKPIAAVPVGRRWCAVSTRFGVITGYSGWLLRRMADLKLFMSLLPPAKAIGTWLQGNRLEESCAICAKPR